MKTIIFFALARWDAPYSSTALSFAKALAVENRVFFVDNPFTWKDLFWKFWTRQIQSRLVPLLLRKKVTRVLDNTNPNFILVTPPVVWPINFLPNGKIYQKISAINNNIVKKTIQGVIKQYNLGQFILVNSFNPFYLYDVADLNPQVTIYQCVDNIEESRYVSRHGPWLEKKMIMKYDLTITTSSGLYQRLSQFCSRISVLPNAADYNHFVRACTNRLDVPKELKGSSKKVIGYIGNICHRIDYELLKRLSKSHHDKLILLIGPRNFPNLCTEEMFESKNVILAGTKSYEELPQYLKYIDCAIIPFKCNTLTYSIYPLKLNEYLGAGRPVVSTAFSPDVNLFHDVISIARNHQEFIEFVDKEINDNSPQKILLRQAKAKSNTWEVRVKQFLEVLKQS